jgi:hypothetical protein
MPTLHQFEANRRNAEKSTGPRTPEGKAAVAQNAITHGIFCDSLLTEGDDPVVLQQLTAGLMSDIAPRNTSERVLAERIISTTWRLRKLGQAEQHMHQRLADGEREDLAESGKYPGEDEDQDACDKLPNRKQDQAQDKIDQRRRDWADEQRFDAGFTLALDLENEKSQAERYSRYEKRLEGTIHRAWRELRLLRKDAESHTPSPLAGEGGGEGEKVQTAETAPPPMAVAESARRELSPSESARPTPHPSPLPQGERGQEQDAASIANVQNKPNSPASEEPAEICAAAIVQPLPRVILRRLPGDMRPLGFDAET